MPDPVEWSWPNTRDRVQVAAGFGLVAGIVALVVAVIHRWAIMRSGRMPASTLQLHAWYLLLYSASGMLIGAFWPRRQQPLGRWTLWVFASIPLSVTIMSLVRGAPSEWSSQSWLQLGVMIPAFAWVLGDGSKRSRTRQEAP